MFPDVIDLDAVSKYPLFPSHHVMKHVIYGGSRAGKTSLMLAINSQYGKVLNVDQMDLATATDELDRVNERANILREHITALECAGIDEYEDGTVIRFNKPMIIRGVERKLAYAAIKKNDAWFVTGVSGPNEVNWTTLVLWAGPDNIANREIVKEWVSL